MPRNTKAFGNPKVQSDHLDFPGSTLTILFIGEVKGGATMLPDIYDTTS